MIIILPHQKTGLEKVLSLMKSLTLDEIIPKNTSEETVQISLPKFRVTSKMYLNDIFQKVSRWKPETLLFFLLPV